MQSFDVLIIGGGPAGSTLAYHLQNSGLSVALIDKKKFPRDKVCAGWVTPEVMRVLNIDLDEYASGRVLQQIKGFRVGITGEQQQQLYYAGAPVSYGIRRVEFDDYLLQRCGAELLPAEAVVKIEKAAQEVTKGWILNDKYQAALIVGAGGHFCPLAHAMQNGSASDPVVVAQEVEFAMNSAQLRQCSIREEIPELFFSPDLLGYGWVVRKGDYLNIGLGREDRSHLSSQVKYFCHYLAQTKKIPAEIGKSFSGHAYLLYDHATRKLCGENYLLIGDAAGLAFRRSGEGIRPAVESAILAARVIVNSARDYRHHKLKLYEDLIETRFGPRGVQSRLLDRMPPSIKNSLARQLMKTHWFSKHILIDKWFLQSGQTPLTRISHRSDKPSPAL